MTDPATRKQIDYIILLGGSVTEGLTKKGASGLIDQLLKKKALVKQQILHAHDKAADTTRLDRYTPPQDDYWKKMPPVPPSKPGEPAKSRTPSKRNNIGCLILIIALSATIGLFIYYDNNEASRDVESSNIVVNDADYADEEMVYVSSYGECYHYYSDCISLENPNAYVEIYRKPYSAVTNTHRACSICMRRRGF